MSKKPPCKDDKSGLQKTEILRSFGFEKILSGYKFNANQFSRTFCKYVTVRLFSNSGLAIYNYKKGIYELDSEEILQKLIKHFMNLFDDLWNPSDATSALKSIKYDTLTVVNQFNNGDFVVLEDKVLDLTDFTLKNHSPDYFSTVQLPFRYEDNCNTPIFNGYLNDITCGDEELKRVLQEITGYCLCSSTAAEKAFFLVGNGCNGKSVYAKLLQMLVGEGNYSTTSLSSFNGNFGLASLINANVNISAENNCGKINSEVFKAVVSGDSVEVNRKYKDAITVKLHTKLIMLFNELPESNDLTYGFFRKLLIVPFKKTLVADEIDVNLIEKLQYELSGIFRWAIEGLQRLRKNQYVFSHCRICESALEAYKSDLNPVAEFFEECFTTDQPEKSILKSQIYLTYTDYCVQNSYDSLQCQKFWRLLKAYFSDKKLDFRIKKIHGREYIVGISSKL